MISLLEINDLPLYNSPVGDFNETNKLGIGGDEKSFSLANYNQENMLASASATEAYYVKGVYMNEKFNPPAMLGRIV